MSDVMLINPSSKGILENAGDRPPLGILYLAEVLRKRNHTVRVRDLDHTTHYDFVDEVDRNPPDYAGVSVYTSPLYGESIELAKYLGDRCKTIAGGYHATAMPQSLTPYFDTVVTNEGELALPLVIEAGLDGIVSGNKYDIKKIPHPARDLIDMKQYGFKQDGRPASTLLSSRGCPNNCVFCGNMNRKVRFHTDKHVIEEVRELKDLGYNDLYFLDDAFTINRERTVSLVSELEKENINYRITTRAKSLDRDLVSMLADSGCSWVSLGIESGNNLRLKDVGKHMTTEDNISAVRMLNERGIKSKGFFMFGLPYESLEDAQMTIDFSKKLKNEGLTSADFYIMTPFPGTPIWMQPTEFGIDILDRDYTQYLEAGKGPSKAFHKTDYMEAEEIEKVRNRAGEEWKQLS